MRKRRWLGFSLPLLIAIAIWGMADSEQRHRMDDSFSMDEVGLANRTDAAPMIMTTSLADTLAPEFIKMVGITDVSGTKFIAPSRTWSSYFSYHADKQKVFSALQQLPFTFTDNKVDLSVRRVSPNDLQRIKSSLPHGEILNAEKFWSPIKDSDVYEFIKPPFRHTLIISETSGIIQHRIEFAG